MPDYGISENDPPVLFSGEESLVSDEVPLLQGGDVDVLGKVLYGFSFKVSGDAESNDTDIVSLDSIKILDAVDSDGHPVADKDVFESSARKYFWDNLVNDAAEKAAANLA